MKTSSSQIGRWFRSQTLLHAPLQLMLALSVALMFSGCRKHQAAGDSANLSPAPDSNEVHTVTAPPPYVPPAGPAPTVAANPDGGADLKQLNHIYIGWIVANHQRPKSFEDFVTLSGVQVPAPPPGQKYFLDKNGFIALEGK